MIEYLKIRNVGPAPEMELELTPRLNLLTGDNGLGKSFLLDIAWWALTRQWPRQLNPVTATGYMARPRPEHLGDASIEFAFDGDGEETRYRGTFDREGQGWTGKAGRPASPSLVLYAQVDGGFSIWDPARNYWRKEGDIDVQDRPKGYVFSVPEVWDGLKTNGVTLCNGLVMDWASWQKEQGEAFQQLRSVLAALSPSPEEPLEPGSLTRISLDDVRDMPSLRMSYGQEVASVHASAGIRRILSLAYLLVWCWQEHKRASVLLGQDTAREIIFLIDEVEAHLHPSWQRVILKSLLEAMNKLAGDGDISIQILTATHSPLVLASAEALFDKDLDAWFDLDLVSAGLGGQVELRRRTWARRGDATNWLMSDAFGLKSGRSVEAEQVLERAAQALSDQNFDREAARQLDFELRKVLSDTDHFWSRWRFVGEKRGWLSR